MPVGLYGFGDGPVRAGRRRVRQGHSRGPECAQDSGSVVAEFAVALPAVVLVLGSVSRCRAGRFATGAVDGCRGGRSQDPRSWRRGGSGGSARAPTVGGRTDEHVDAGRVHLCRTRCAGRSGSGIPGRFAGAGFRVRSCRGPLMVVQVGARVSIGARARAESQSQSPGRAQSSSLRSSPPSCC